MNYVLNFDNFCDVKRCLHFLFSGDELRLARSRFLYKETFQSSSDASEIKRDLVDEDGDLNPVRKEEANYGAVFIGSTIYDLKLHLQFNCYKFLLILATTAANVSNN